MSSNRPSSRPSSSAPACPTPSSFDPSNRMSRQGSTNRRCLHRYFIRSSGLRSERRSSDLMTMRRNPARSYSDHIFSVSSQCRKYASTIRTISSSAILPSPSDPNIADYRLKLSASQCSLPGAPTVRHMQDGRRDLFATIAQCLNLEHEIRHTLSKLCILSLEPLEWSLIAAFGDMSIRTAFRLPSVLTGHLQTQHVLYPV